MFLSGGGGSVIRASHLNLGSHSTLKEGDGEKKMESRRREMGM